MLAYHSATRSRGIAGCASHQFASDSPAPTIAWAAASAASSGRPASPARRRDSRRTVVAIWARSPVTSSATGRLALASLHSTRQPSRCSSTNARNSSTRARNSHRRGSSGRRPAAVARSARARCHRCTRRTAPPWSRSTRTASAWRRRPRPAITSIEARWYPSRANTAPGHLEDQPLALGARHPSGSGRGGGGGGAAGKSDGDNVVRNPVRDGYYSRVDARARRATKRSPDPAPGAEGAQRFSSPLLVDDYLELINPLWSTRELRGRIEEIRPETADAATVLIKPGYRWSGHRPGQYLRIGLDIEGVRHWRAYSLTSDPWREDGLISITVKNVDEGKVSPYLVRRGRPGTIVSLGGVEGDFTLPDDLPESSCSSAPAAASRRS